MAKTPKKARKFNKLAAGFDRKFLEQQKLEINAGGMWGDYKPFDISTFQKKVNKRPKKGKVSGSGFTEVREGDGRSVYSDYNVVTRVVNDATREHRFQRSDSVGKSMADLASKHNLQFEKLSKTQFAPYLKPNSIAPLIERSRYER